MRRTTYLIDDKVGFRKQQLSDELVETIHGFRVYYTLEENDKKEIFYCLEDLQGNKISINSLNNYEKMYINECLDCFMKNRKILKRYEDFIEILEQPRKIKHEVNMRYKLFKEYAKQNNIKDNMLEYTNFIDKFSYEFEKAYNKTVLANQEQFDEFIKQKVLGENNISSEEEEVL